MRRQITIALLGYFFTGLQLTGQIDPAKIDTLDCDDYRSNMSTVLQWDTLGGKGVKLPVTEFLFSHGCGYLGRPVDELVKHYGEPDVQFEWNSPRRTVDRVFTYRYKLYTHTYEDIYTFGDKWLHITTNAEKVITNILIHTVDE